MRRALRLIVGIVAISNIWGSVHAQGISFQEDKPFEKQKVIHSQRFSKALFDSSHAFDVLHYRLDLRFPIASNAFSGTVTATCVSKEDDLDEVSFHMVDLVVDSVLLDGTRLNASQTAGQVVLSLSNPVAAGDTFTVTIAYHGAPHNAGFYFYEMCAYTFAEPVDARRWFPCYDVPWDKATAELHVTVPKGVEVASIGLLEGRDISGDGKWETFHWRSVHPVSTYLICVTMSKCYARWSDWYVTPTMDSVEIVYYIFTRDSAKAKNDFVNMVAAMTFFSDRFGAYPFEKYGMAEVEPCGFGGMEHQTMTTINSSWIRGDRSRENGLVHELAHMWWGDAVTLNDWPAIWLNEGFAVYSEALFIEHQYGREAFQNYMAGCKSIYISQTGFYDFPIYDPIGLFDYGIVYKKGGCVLHMLRTVVGDENFWRILKTYYGTYKYSNASIPEFQTVCETVSGMGLEWFFREWIYEDGYIRLEYSWGSSRLASGKYEVFLSLDPVKNENFRFRMPVVIRVEGSSDSKDTILWIERLPEYFSIQIDFEPVDLHIDPDGWILMEAEHVHRGIRRSERIPLRFALHQNFPNPFNAGTTVYYDLPATKDSWKVRLVVYDLLGRRVRTLWEKVDFPGEYWRVWDGTDEYGRLVSTGVYIIELSTDGLSAKRKAVVAR